MYLSAKSLQKLIESIRARAFEDAAKVIGSMETDKEGFVYLPDVVNLIGSIDSEKVKQNKETIEAIYSDTA